MKIKLVCALLVSVFVVACGSGYGLVYNASSKKVRIEISDFNYIRHQIILEPKEYLGTRNKCHRKKDLEYIKVFLVDNDKEKELYFLNKDEISEITKDIKECEVFWIVNDIGVFAVDERKNTKYYNTREEMEKYYKEYGKKSR